jgi:hypothetical protein
MKARLSIMTMFLMITSIVAIGQGIKWKYMGERLVNDRLDHDVIMVTAARGALSAIQIRVKGAPVDFHRVIIVYGNGKRQEVAMRNTIGPGGASRPIDLIGDDRIVRSVEFWYDANTTRGRKAIVRLFGRG